MAFSNFTVFAKRLVPRSAKFVIAFDEISAVRTPMMSSAVRRFHATPQNRDIFTVQDEEDFKSKVISSSKPVVVEFHATWCGPCKQLMPRLETIIGGLPNEPVDLAKVDIDELPEIAMEYGVGAVPSVLLLNKGKVLDKFIGLQDEDKIKKFVSGVLK